MKISGTRIREARHAAHMTQAALAMAVGTRERNIIRWENEQNAPRAENVAALAATLRRPIEFFYPSPEVDADTAPFRDAA